MAISTSLRWADTVPLKWCFHKNKCVFHVQWVHLAFPSTFGLCSHNKFCKDNWVNCNWTRTHFFPLWDACHNSDILAFRWEFDSIQLPWWFDRFFEEFLVLKFFPSIFSKSLFTGNYSLESRNLSEKVWRACNLISIQRASQLASTFIDRHRSIFPKWVSKPWWSWSRGLFINRWNSHKHSKWKTLIASNPP